MLKLAATLVAGLGGIVALTVAYRKQREQELRRDSLRFDAAAQQLGGDDGAIRLAGVYAATALADESPRLRAAVVEHLCAYLRLNRADDGPVQQTILEAIGQRTRRGGSGPRSWNAYDLDLHGVSISDRLTWLGSHFMGTVNLEGATFQHDVTWVGIQFDEQLMLNDARFERECLAIMAQFRGTVLMNRVVFENGLNAIDSSFDRGLQAGSTKFNRGASFANSRFMNGAVFAGAEFAYASFANCVFARGAEGDQSDAVYNGDAHFGRTEFRGADFSGAIFHSKVLFDGAQFSTDSVTFAGARMLDGGTLDGAHFTGPMPEELRDLAKGKGAA